MKKWISCLLILVIVVASMPASLPLPIRAESMKNDSEMSITTDSDNDTQMINDNDGGVTYSGSWSVSSGRGGGTYNTDVHYTSANDAYCEYTFTGSGIDYITETDSNQGNVEVYIDGTKQTTVSTSSSTHKCLQTVFSVVGLNLGDHTIRLVKKSGSYMLVDAFNVTNIATDISSVSGVALSVHSTYIEKGSKISLAAAVAPANATNKAVAWSSNNEAVAAVDEEGMVTGIEAGEANIEVTTIDGHYQDICTVSVVNSEDSDPLPDSSLVTMINDNNSSITYHGSWGNSGSRGAGDYKDDIHYTSSDNDSVEFTFEGTGVEIIMPTDSSQGDVDIYIDGIFKKKINTYGANYQPKQIIYCKQNLGMGQHTVKCIKKNARYMQVDAFGITNYVGDVTEPAVLQSGENPIVFNQTAETDNLITLMAAGSEHNMDLLVADYGYPKHFWISNFGSGNGDDYLKWTVNLETGANYYVWALLSSGEKIPFTLSDGDSELDFVTSGIGWDKQELGTIYIPSGSSTLKLVKCDDNSNNKISIKSLELIRESDKSAYEQRVTNFKKDTTWLADSGYGLMFQYGAWGYPESGDRKSMEQATDDFNVTDFVNMVKGTGASYVIWSITWWQYWMQAPITSVDTIMGDGDKTSSRDLIGEVAAALHAQGIRFMLYYHQGIQQEPDWAAKQNWPAEFETRGTGDKSTFINNWCNIISEIGNRYGTNLDGWFFDDGCIYYPAPFEQLGAAARAGNPDRLISYNPWVSARITDFQDVYFAEGSHGESQYGSSAAGGNGIFTDGPQEGLLQQAMFTMEQDWGVHEENQPITVQITSNQAIAWLKNASQRKVPLTFNLMMWEDGTVSQDSLNILTAVKNADLSISAPPGMINDNDIEVTYNGSWNTSSGRGIGDYQDDIHYTSESGDACEYTFEGTGIEFITETNVDEGDIDVYIDGIKQSTISCYSSSRRSQQTIYSVTGLANGSHTIKLVNTSKSYMIVDAFRVTLAVTGVSLKEETINIRAGESESLTATVSPENAGNKNVTWDSSDETVAEVDSSGKVTGMKSGTAIIKITTQDGQYQAICTINVKAAEPTETPTVPTETPIPEPTQIPAVPVTVPTVIPTPTPAAALTPAPVQTTEPIKVNGQNLNLQVSIIQDKEKGSISAAIEVPSDDISKLASAGKRIELSIPVSSKYVLDLMKQEGASSLNLTVNVPSELLTSDKVDLSDISLDSKILDAAKAAGSDVTVKVADETGKVRYSWTFSGENLTSSDNIMSNVNLALTVDQTSNSSVINSLLTDQAGDAKGIVVNFNHHGVLPVQSSVRIYVGDKEELKSGDRVYLYYYNSVTNKLETLPYSSNYKVDKSGYITIDLIHCSEYIILPEAADSRIITSLIDQIKVTPTNKTLYYGGTKDSKITIRIELPDTLELVNDINEKPSAKAIGAVKAAYISGNKKVATVNKDGVITAVGTGTAKITTAITLYSGKVKMVNTTITVKKPSIVIKKSVSKMKLGSQYMFSADAYGYDSKDIVWVTDKKSIITIDKKTGNATAKSAGTDYVIAKVGNTEVKRKIVVIK